MTEKSIGRVLNDIDPVPETPRDLMWTAIQAARAEERASAPTSDVAYTDVIPFAAKKLPTTHTWLRWGAPLAAMLVIGVGLGRWTTHNMTASSATQAPQQTVAHATSAQPAPDTAANSTLQKLNTPPIVAVTPPASSGLAVSVKHGNSRMATTGIVRAAPSANNNANTSENTVAYRMAAVNHFARVQTLLITMPGDARDGHINEIAVRAADLLVNTRLLLDSPAAKDAETHRLLDDLELILAQVATISPTKSAEDVDIIQDAITKHNVLLRLRAMTAGPRLSGT